MQGYAALERIRMYLCQATYTHLDWSLASLSGVVALWILITVMGFYRFAYISIV